MDEHHTRYAAMRLAELIVSGDDDRSLGAKKLLAGMLSYWLHVALQGQLNMAAELANPSLPVEQLWQQMRARCPAVADAVGYVRGLPASERASVELTAYRATVVAIEHVLTDRVAATTAMPLATNLGAHDCRCARARAASAELASSRPRRERKRARFMRWPGRSDSV